MATPGDIPTPTAESTSDSYNGGGITAAAIDVDVAAGELRRHDEEEEVESVLSVWFDGCTADNHRTKWFAQGDALPRMDETIRKDFGNLVLRAEAGQLTDSWSERPRSMVALILLLDQFSRHLFRGAPDRDERVGRCDRLALPLTEALLDRGWQHGLTAEQHVFALMPLRHTPSEERLLRVMQEAEERVTRLRHSQELLQRFKKATKRRLQGIQDRAEEGAEILEHFEFDPPEPSQMDKHELVKVLRGFLDTKGAVATAARPPASGTPAGARRKCGGTDASASGGGNSGDAITGDCRDSADNHSVTPSDTNNNNDKNDNNDDDKNNSSNTTTNNSNISSSSSSSNNNSVVTAGTDITTATKADDNDTGRNNNSSGGGALRTVAVSLSGGVDSMALCRALVHLQPVYGFEVVGIHIDYGNRHESGREADFVQGWCARHGVVFYKRAI
ncbi:unnamed protein product, partial [Ectocarpus sp. 8 AP-2014]